MSVEDVPPQALKSVTKVVEKIGSDHFAKILKRVRRVCSLLPEALFTVNTVFMVDPGFFSKTITTVLP